MISLRSIRCPADQTIVARLSMPRAHKLGPGEIIRVFGPNGVGKTTLLRIIAGLEADYTGVVEMASSLQIRLIPTNVMDLLLPWYSVINNARVLLHHNPHDGSAIRSFAALVERFLPGEVERLQDLAADTLSAGEKAAVACACALASRPNVIALDETLSYMAPPLASRVVPALLEFAAGGGLLLVVGHYMPEQMVPTRDIALTMESAH